MMLKNVLHNYRFEDLQFVTVLWNVHPCLCLLQYESIEITNKMQSYNRIYYSKVY